MTRISPSTIAFLALILLTILSYFIAEGSSATLLIGLCAMAIGLVKVQIVISHFMHMEWRHKPFRQVLTAWLLIVAIIFIVGLGALPWERVNV